jgi:hypothetical protein
MTKTRTILEEPDKEEKGQNQKKRLKNGCLPKTTENPKYKVTSNGIRHYIQRMKDHALIGKFMGIWPSEKSLQIWIKARWKVKGRIDLELGSKGFFTTVFSDSADREKVFEEGPYFFNSRPAHEILDRKFRSRERNLRRGTGMDQDVFPPKRILGTKTLEGIGNTPGSFVKISEVTKSAKYISYARICVYMNVAGALPESIIVSYQDDEWTQPLDYKHIPFRCRKCHIHGHLFRDCPLNSPPQGTPGKEEIDPEGFTKIQTNKRHGLKTTQTSRTTLNKNSSNSFQILEGEPSEAPTKEQSKETMVTQKETIEPKEDEGKRCKKEEEPVEKGPEDTKVKMKETPDSGAESTEESDMDASQAMELEEVELDLPRLREIHGLEKINSLTIVHIRRLQKDLENGKGKEKTSESEPPPSGVMGIKKNPLKSPKKLSGEEKRRGQKPYRQKIEET